MRPRKKCQSLGKNSLQITEHDQVKMQTGFEQNCFNPSQLPQMQFLHRFGCLGAEVVQFLMYQRPEQPILGNSRQFGPISQAFSRWLESQTFFTHRFSQLLQKSSYTCSTPQSDSMCLAKKSYQNAQDDVVLPQISCIRTRKIAFTTSDIAFRRLSL